MLDVLITTLIKRPYVIAFLVAYLIIAYRVTGLRWTLLHLISGYWIAFASEVLSINFGFPYGWYHYVYENLQGEWLNFGVPVWDSASYVFMSFAGLCAAHITLGERLAPTREDKFKLIFLSAIFVTLLDVVIDPVAHLGEHWFLGKIYFYPTPGPYFDVTLSNFAGWFLTSLVINGVGVFAWDYYNLEQMEDGSNPRLGLGLYFGIFSFGLAIALYLEQWSLVACDTMWFGMTALAIHKARLAHKRKKAHEERNIRMFARAPARSLDSYNSQ